MRKYTKKLLIGFKRLSEKPEARMKARAREALGIAIISEAGIEKEDLRTTGRSGWMGEMKASFNEMIDERWIEQIPPTEDSSDYLEFENAIGEFYHESTTDLSYLREKILKKEYPFGDHWFRLTSLGEKRASVLVNKGSKLKAFLSYSRLDKKLAGHIKHALKECGIEAFLAHEDVEPSVEWVEEIKTELETCNIFLPILTNNFHNSDWTDQETGIAFTRDKLIIPLKVKKDPYGFISKIQAFSLDPNAIVSSCHELVEIINSKLQEFGTKLQNE